MVVFEHTARYVPKMVDDVTEDDGLQLQLIEYMPPLVGSFGWVIAIERVHDWFAKRADSVTIREMPSRRRYHVGEGMVEIIDPVGDPMFWQNCHCIWVMHEASIKGCLNRNDDLRLTDEMTTAEVRETVHNRIPYYDMYFVKDDDKVWGMNEKYQEQSPAGDLMQ